MKTRHQLSKKRPSTIYKLQDHMINEGFVCNERIICDGIVHPFHIEGDPEGTRDNWYVAINREIFVACFGSFKTGQKISHSHIPVDKLSPDQQTSYDDTMEEMEDLYQAELSKHHAKRSVALSQMYYEANDADPNFPALDQWGIGAHDIKQKNTALLIPAKKGDEITNIQVIGKNRSKYLMEKIPLNGAHHQIGNIDNETLTEDFDKQVLVVTIAYEVAASINEATGLTTAASLEADNLRQTVEYFILEHPTIHIIIAANDDQLADGSSSFTQARNTAEEFDVPLAKSIFVSTHNKRADKPKSFNDQHVLGEQNAIKIAIDDATTLKDKMAFLALIHSSDEYKNELSLAADFWGDTPQSLGYKVEQHLKYEAYARCGGEFPLRPNTAWHKEVDIKPVANSVLELFQRYSVTPPGADVFLTMWTFSTYFHDAFQYFPICLITSPIKGAGKTTAVEIQSAVCMDTITTTDITSASIPRVIEIGKATLILDEADTYIPNDHQFKGKLNASVKAFGSVSIRCESNGTGFYPKAFKTSTPIVISMIDAYGKLFSTVLDRSIIVPMERKSLGEITQRIPRNFYDQCEEIRRMLMRWAADNIHILTELLDYFEPEVPHLFNRSLDKWRPLLAVAELIGGEWPKLTLKAIENLENFDIDDEDLELILLSDTRDVLSGFPHKIIRSQELVGLLLDMDGRPWSGLPDTGRKLSTAKMANMLRRFRIKPAQGRRPGEPNLRGYLISDFMKTFERYLPTMAMEGIGSPANTTNEPAQGPDSLKGVILLPKARLARWQPTSLA